MRRNVIALQRLAAEFVGTFGLVFAGTGAIIINTVTDGTVSHVGIGLTFGLIIMVMIYAFGHVSGAHFNPAVTLAFAAGRHFPWPLVPQYWAAQLAGGITASLVHRALFGDVAHLGATLPLGSAGQSLRPGDRAHLDPDGRDHVGRHRYPRRGTSGGDRHRRHDRPGGPLCRVRSPAPA